MELREFPAEGNAALAAECVQATFFLIGKSAEAEGNTEPALPEEPKQSEPTEPKKIYEDDRDDPDYVPFD